MKKVWKFVKEHAGLLLALGAAIVGWIMWGRRKGEPLPSMSEIKTQLRTIDERQEAEKQRILAEEKTKLEEVDRQYEAEKTKLNQETIGLKQELEQDPAKLAELLEKLTR